MNIDRKYVLIGREIITVIFIPCSNYIEIRYLITKSFIILLSRIE